MIAGPPEGPTCCSHSEPWLRGPCSPPGWPALRTPPVEGLLYDLIAYNVVSLGAAALCRRAAGRVPGRAGRVAGHRRRVGVLRRRQPALRAGPLPGELLPLARRTGLPRGLSADRAAPAGTRPRPGAALPPHDLAGRRHRRARRDRRRHDLRPRAVAGHGGPGGQRGDPDLSGDGRAAAGPCGRGHRDPRAAQRPHHAAALVGLRLQADRRRPADARAGAGHLRARRTDRSVLGGRGAAHRRGRGAGPPATP